MTFEIQNAKEPVKADYTDPYEHLKAVVEFGVNLSMSFVYQELSAMAKKANKDIDEKYTFCKRSFSQSRRRWMERRKS